MALEFTHKVTSLLRAWITRLHVTENVMTVLISFCKATGINHLQCRCVIECKMVALCGLSIAPELHLAGPLSTFIPSYTSSFLPSVSKLTRLTEVSSKKYPQIFEKLQILAEPQQKIIVWTAPKLKHRGCLLRSQRPVRNEKTAWKFFKTENRGKPGITQKHKTADNLKSIIQLWYKMRNIAHISALI